MRCAGAITTICRANGYMAGRAVSVFALSVFLASAFAGGAFAAPYGYIFSDQNDLVSLHVTALDLADGGKAHAPSADLSFAMAERPRLDLSALPDIDEVPGMSARRLREATECTACTPEDASRQTGRPASLFEEAYREAAIKGWQAGYAVMAAEADDEPPAAKTANFGSERAYLSFIRRIVRGWQQAVIDIYEADGRLAESRAARYRAAIGGTMLPLAASDKAPLSARFGWASGAELAMQDRWRRESERTERASEDEEVRREAHQSAAEMAPTPMLRPERPAAPAPVDLMPVAQFVSGLAWQHLAPGSLMFDNGKALSFWMRTAGTWKVGQVTRRLATSAGASYPLGPNWKTGTILTWEAVHRSAAAYRNALNGRAWLVTPYLAWKPESHTRIRVYGGYGWREDRVMKESGIARYAGQGWLGGASVQAKWKLDEAGRLVFTPSGSLDATRISVADLRDGAGETRTRKRATGEGRLTLNMEPTEYFSLIEPYSAFSSQWRLDRIAYGADDRLSRHIFSKAMVETGVKLKPRLLPFTTSLRARLSDAQNEVEEFRLGWRFDWPL